MSWESQSNWEVLAAVAAVGALGAIGWAQFIAPGLRRRTLGRPCKAFFHIAELAHGDLEYVIQDDDAHNVTELVLPSNSVCNLEVAYYPTIAFCVHRTVFGIDGEMHAKPLALERFTRFITDGKGKNRWVPGVDASDSLDRKGNYHYDSAMPGRAVGSCYTMGFKIKTRSEGVFKAWLGFLTDEVDGSATLTLRIENRPRTRMVCRNHKGCRLRPAYRAERQDP